MPTKYGFEKIVTCLDNFLKFNVRKLFLTKFIMTYYRLYRVQNMGQPDTGWSHLHFYFWCLEFGFLVHVTFVPPKFS